MNQNVQAIASAHTGLVFAIKAYEASLESVKAARPTTPAQAQDQAAKSLRCVIEIRERADELAQALAEFVAPY